MCNCPKSNSSILSDVCGSQPCFPKQLPLNRKIHKFALVSVSSATIRSTINSSSIFPFQPSTSTTPAIMSLKQLKQATGDLTPASFRRPRCPLHSRDKDIYRDLVLRSTRTSEPSNSPFFTKLPAELRRMILVLAFGNGTIRLEINTESEKGQPIVQFPTDLPLGSCKCAPVNHVGNENPWIYDQSDPSRSYYDQSISRRRKWPFYVWRSFYRRMDDEGEHEDEEISRQRWLSYEWQNHKPKFVDSFLGWISSCRQAYAPPQDPTNSQKIETDNVRIIADTQRESRSCTVPILSTCWVIQQCFCHGFVRHRPICWPWSHPWRYHGLFVVRK